MTGFTTFLARVDAAALAGIGVLAFVGWLRRRGAKRACLAAALGLLGLVSAMGQVSDIQPLPWPIAVLNLFCFMASGYALVEFRHQLIPLPRGVRPRVLLLLLVTCVLAIPLTISPDQAHPGRFTWMVATLLILEWVACIAEPAIRFLLTSRGLPVVQRNRLRALSLGYLGIAVALLLALGAAAGAAVASARPNAVAGLAFQVAATAMIPLLFTGFAPPKWLRRAWRDSEADTYRGANEALMTFSDDPLALADRAVEWAMRFVGASAGLMLSPTGAVLASRGLHGVEVDTLAERARSAAPDGEVAAIGEEVNIVPVPMAVGAGRLAVVAGPFTPTFGSDELLMLTGYANSLAVAMDRVRLSESLRDQTRRLESLLQAVSELGAGLMISDHGVLSFANDAYLELTGFELHEVQGRPLAELMAEADRPDVMVSTNASVAGPEPSRHEIRLVRKGGGTIDTETVFQQFMSEGSNKVIALVQDITARKRAERALAETARLDPLTAVPNRRAWQEQLVMSLERAALDHLPLCVAILDLDNFKEFNDDWGHQRGDRLLVDVAQAWRGALRDSDFLARYGGDEFAMIMPACPLAHAESVLQRVTGASPEEASIGLAEWDGSETADELVARADAALLRSKRDRRGKITVADELGQDRYVSWSMRLEDVLTRRYLTTAYQPIVSLDDRRVFGYEALLRMSGSPADASVEELFATAQRSGHSRALDWVGRRTALECAGGLPAGSLLFVNVSARALLDPLHGSDQMLMLLRWAQRDAQGVVLEISEREMISNLTRFCEVLAEYRSHGFQFALDDVGEGHSTLEVLAAANAEYIKVARSLTENVGMPGPRAAIQAIVTFAGSSGATVIAEGISEAGVAEAMRALGVRLGQGYALGRPEYFPAPRGAPALEAV